jgi:dihydroneopterin aldolase
METLTLKSLQFHAYHGYYEKERKEGNNFEVDLIFKADLRKAGSTDDLNDTIDYQNVLEEVQAVMNGPSMKLIETLTKKIGDRLFEHFARIQSLDVIVRKLNPPLDVNTEYSEIRMQWQR